MYLSILPSELCTSQGWARSSDVMSTFVLVALLYILTKHSVMGSARGYPGSTCISPVWLEKM